MNDQSNARYGVVVACQRDDGRWLMVRRAATVERAPLKVGFIGGEIEPGETQQQAAVREAMEEVGITIEPIQRVWEYDWPENEWYLYAWHCRWVSGEVKRNADEIAEVLWLTTQEGAAHPDALPTMPALCQVLTEKTP